MNDPQQRTTIAQQVAKAIRDFQERRTGHAPKSVTVVLSEGTLVVTLHEVLTPAELALARTSEGAAKIRQFHRELFQSSVGELKEAISRITGVAVREAAAEVETATGAIVHVFTSGTMVQVFQLDGGMSTDAWHGTAKPPGAASEDRAPELNVDRT
jgi:uncharacterized protein YbcI